MKNFAVCTKSITLHNKTAFHRGHVYVVDRKVTRMPLDESNFNFNLTSEQDNAESFPHEYFNEHFSLMNPL